MSNIFIKLLGSVKEYRTVFNFWIIFLMIGLLSRVVLLSVYADSNGLENYIYSLLYGFRMDTIIFSALWIIFIFFYIFNLKAILKVLLTVSMITYLWIELVTFEFLDNFSSRPNYLFIEHFGNYEEIFGMIIKLYPIYFISSLVLLVFLTYKLYKYFNIAIKTSPIKNKLISLPIILVLLALGARSSLDSSTPNQGFYTFSNKNIYNEVANNSIFSVLYATYLSKKEKSFNYGDLNSAESIEMIKKEYWIDNNTSTLLRFQKSSSLKQKNIILVILESFGHKHVGFLGGTPTTPNLDALRDDSLYFTNMYAAGTRTSWGVSSVLTSLYPIPSREYVKARKSQKDFYTIARSLKKSDYTNIFLYSGDVDFDNMRGFLLSNGYDNVLGKESFDDSLTKYTWGYCDEDLYDKAITLIESKKDKPYFLTLLTMSSHEPFDYPKGRVEPYSKAPLEGFENSVKYADYSIGKFIQKLKEKGLLKDAVVAFIADHNEKPYGKFDVPIDRYKIPALIISDEYSKNGKEYSKIASQIDFAPTILDIAGVSIEIPTMGSSVLINPRDTAIVKSGNRYAYLLKDKFIIYKPKKKTNSYNYDLEVIPSIENEVKSGLSFINASKYLYDKKLYKEK